MSSVTDRTTGLRWLLAALLVVATGLFIVGVARERSLHHSEARSEKTAREPSHTEGGDGDHHAGEATTPATRIEAHAEVASEGRVLGVDIETWPLALSFAAVSLGLAVAVVQSRNRTVVAVVALVAGVAAVFDIAEIVHQTNESQTVLVVIAAAVTALHLAAAAIAVLLLVQSRPAAPAVLSQSSLPA